MTATVNGITEPVVVGIAEGSNSPSDTTTGGDVAKGVLSSAAKGASYGSVIPVFGTIAGAIIGALSDAFSSMANVTKTTPDDARRFLYEIGYVPGVTLKTARVTQDVSPQDMLLIRHARYVEISDRKDYGLDTVNGWLEKAGETTGNWVFPLPVGDYLNNMAEAYIALQHERLMTADNLADAKDVEVPNPDSPDVQLPPYALHLAILNRFRSDDTLVNQARAGLHRKNGATQRYEAWVAKIQKTVGDRGDNPFIPSSYGWFWGAYAIAVSAAVGAVIYYQHYKGKSPFRSLEGEIRQALGLRADGHMNELSVDPNAGLKAYRRVLTKGVTDGELEYLRTGMRPMEVFHRAFSNARTFGISATDLASRGRYFGDRVLPIRINVQPDGTVHLDDGRHRYMAAKMAGASAILADIIRYNSNGDVVEEKQAVVKLR